MKIIAVITLAAATLITGCAAMDPSVRMARQGYPKAYIAAYEDGCSSGENAAGSIMSGFRKDVRAFAASGEYQQGWSDGFAVCNGKYKKLR